jgi:murein DD-endopeptidase MepM/ murein hydrolase activator NlpD
VETTISHRTIHRCGYPIPCGNDLVWLKAVSSFPEKGRKQGDAMRIILTAFLLCACGAGLESNIQSYKSQEQEYTSAQIVGAKPPIFTTRATRPTSASYMGSFSGSVGKPAGHEGTDYVNNNKNTVDVPVVNVLAGQVVYVRYGCPQSAVFTRNLTLRECGAGWGNHVVIHHGNGVYTRHGHLKPASIKVSVFDTLAQGDAIALMGNSGRSELRHLHFELGTKKTPFIDKAPAQNFDYVYNPEILFK